MTAEIEHRRNLAQAVSREVAGGYRVESQTDAQAVMVKGKSVNHTLHLILTLVTFFCWAPVWVVMAFVQKPKRLILTLDEFGNVLRQDV